MKLKKFWLDLQPHPFRLLLHLEWLLLGLTALLITGKFLSFNGINAFSWAQLNLAEVPILIFLILVFGAMGLRLPNQSWIVKLVYTALELTLLGIAANFLDWDINNLTPLLVVIILRSCLIFQHRARWVVIGLIGLAYLLSRLPSLVLLFFILEFMKPGWLNKWKSDHEFSSDVLTILPNGGIKLNIQFTKEQVEAFISLLQNLAVKDLVGNSVLFILVLIFVMLLVNALIRERKGRRQLALAHEQLYQYSRQIEDQATLQERTRIAREIHDSLGHLLTAQSIQLENSLLSLGSSNINEAKIFLASSRHLGINALEELRQSVTKLRSDPLRGRTLEIAIADLIDDFQNITGIAPNCQITLNSIPTRIQVAVYRILSEALTNISKYSRATEVNIRLTQAVVANLLDRKALSINDSQLTLQIEDNGIGFSVEQNTAGFGLRGMQERASSLGGQFQLVSQPQSGCQITVHFPIIGGIET